MTSTIAANATTIDRAATFTSERTIDAVNANIQSVDEPIGARRDFKELSLERDERTRSGFRYELASPRDIGLLYALFGAELKAQGFTDPSDTIVLHGQDIEVPNFWAVSYSANPDAGVDAQFTRII